MRNTKQRTDFLQHFVFSAAIWRPLSWHARPQTKKLVYVDTTNFWF